MVYRATQVSKVFGHAILRHLTQMKCMELTLTFCDSQPKLAFRIISLKT